MAAVVGPAVFTTGAKRLTEVNEVWASKRTDDVLENSGGQLMPLRAVFAGHGWEHCLQDDTRLFLRHPAHTSFQRLKPCRRTRVWSTCAACENHFRNTNGDGVLNREQPTAFRESPVISFRPPSFASNQTGTIVHCTIIVVTRALTP